MSPSAFRRQAPGSRGAGCRSGKARPAKVDLEPDAYGRGFADGEKSGFERGECAGREEASARLENVLQRLEKTLSDLHGLQTGVCRGLEKQTVELALDVARKIVGREVQTDVQAVAHVVRTALRRLEHAERITIRMNPEDLQRIAEFAPRLLAEITDAKRVHFEGDAAISCGGCRIESDSGDIDARLEQRYKAVEEAFQTEWSRQVEHPG